MDILVCIPVNEENRVRATKLNPISGLTDGYWTLSGHPRFAKRGDRIWFSIFGEVVASAKIMDPHDEWDEHDSWLDEGRPAVRFDVPTVMGHEFDTPHKVPGSFRGFRYVRRAEKYVGANKTKALKIIGAKKAEKLYPNNW
jgi:hypothetical protein